MSKILLFHRNFGLDQGRKQIVDKKCQRREPGVLQDQFFSRTCQRGRNISCFLFPTFRKHVEHFDHSIVSRVYGYRKSWRKKNCWVSVKFSRSFASCDHNFVTAPSYVISEFRSEYSLSTWSESCWLYFIWVTAFPFVAVSTKEWGCQTCVFCRQVSTMLIKKDWLLLKANSK